MLSVQSAWALNDGGRSTRVSGRMLDLQFWACLSWFAGYFQVHCFSLWGNTGVRVVGFNVRTPKILCTPSRSDLDFQHSPFLHLHIVFLTLLFLFYLYICSYESRSEFENSNVSEETIGRVRNTYLLVIGNLVEGSYLRALVG